MRWFFRILIVLAALIVLAIVFVQIVLWTNIPKNLVVSEIQQQLGLRIVTDRLTTGWLGSTTLRNVSLSLPLADRSFLAVKTLSLKHTSLWGLLVGRSFAVDSIELDEPTILVRQNVDGQWNVAEVAQLLARAGGGQSVPGSEQQGVPKLPSLAVVDGVIRVSDNQGHTAELPLDVSGSPDGALVWKYNVRMGNGIRFVGRVAPGFNWQHQITFQATDLDSVLKNWGAKSYGADIAGEWRGQMNDGRVTGWLNLDHFTAEGVPGMGKLAAHGALEIAAGNGAVTMHPRRITITTSNPTLPNIQVAEGTVTANANGIHADAMRLAVLGGLAVLDARFDPKTMAGDLSARWNDLVLSNHITHSGSLTASLETPFEGHPSIRLDLASQGNTATGHWQAEIALAGNGQSWQSIDWSLTAPILQWTGGQTIELTHLIGHIRQRGPQIDLTDLTLPGQSHLSSRASINLQNHNWFFWLDAGGGQASDGTTIPIAVSINAWGNDVRYTLQDLNFSAADAVVWAGGFYDRRIPNPVNMDVYLMQSPEFTPDSPIRGRVGGSFHISGLLFREDEAFHPHLDITGNLKSNGLVLLDRAIGDMNVQLSGIIDNRDADISTSEMRLLGGRWNVNAHWDPEEPTELNVSVRDLPVEQLAQLAKVSGLSGQVAEASWELEIPRPINLNQIRMQSEYQLVGLNVKGIDIEKAAARISLRDGYLKLDSLEARTGKGLATASMTYDLNDRERLDLVANLNQWTFGTPGGASVRLSADTKLAIDLSRKSALGPIKATADLLLNNAPLGHTEMVAALRGRVLDIKTISGTVSSGNISGMANIDMDRPMEAQGRIQWAGIDAATMGAISPELKGLGGTYSGTITLAPALDPRPLEPLRIDINMSASGGHFRSIKIGDGLVSVHAVAYANTNRAVLDHSEIKIAGGVVHIWARLGRDLVSQIAQVDFENLQLDQIAHVNPAQAGAMPGLLSGQFAVIGSGNDLDELVGNGKIRLTHTDLGNFGPMAALYNAMNHGSGGVNTSGVGLADLTLEQSVLKVTNFRFFNRGIDARGLFSIGPSVWDLHEAQAGGQVTGALRPLKNSRISFLAELDELSSSLQGALTTINISGTVGQPKYNLAAFSQLSGALKELIRGDSPTQ